MADRLATNARELEREFAPLYHRFPGETNPQAAYIEIDPQAQTLVALYDGEVGGAVPMAVWHHRVLRFRVAPTLRGTAIADILECEMVQELAQRICAGHSVHWDGSNRVGRLTDDAQAAAEALQQHLLDSYGDICAEHYHVQPCAPDEWAQYAQDIGITANTSDEELERKGVELYAEARANGVLIDGNLGERLCQLRDQLRNN